MPRSSARASPDKFEGLEQDATCPARSPSLQDCMKILQGNHHTVYLPPVAKLRKPGGSFLSVLKSGTQPVDTR